MAEQPIVAFCPRCLRRMDDDVEANRGCIRYECDPPTPESLTEQFIGAVRHCDEEAGDDGMCECAGFIQQTLRLLMSPASVQARAATAVLVTALREIVARAPNKEPEYGGWVDDTDAAESWGLQAGLWEAAEIARGALARIGKQEVERDATADLVERERLEEVARIAAVCTMDLASNLNSAHDEYMRGDIPHGAYSYVLSRQSALLQALRAAGFTEKHPLFEFPLRPERAAADAQPEVQEIAVGCTDPESLDNSTGYCPGRD